MKKIDDMIVCLQLLSPSFGCPCDQPPPAESFNQFTAQWSSIKCNLKFRSSTSRRLQNRYNFQTGNSSPGSLLAFGSCSVT